MIRKLFGNNFNNEDEEQIAYINYLKLQLKEERNKNEQANQLINRIQSELNEMSGYNQYRTELLQEREKLNELIERNKLLLILNEQYKEQLQAQEQIKAGLETKNEHLQQELYEMTKNYEQLKEQFEPLLKMSSENKQFIVEMNQQLETTKQQIITDTTNIIQQMEKEIREYYQSQLDVLSKEKNELSKEYSQLQELYAESEQQLKKTRQQLNKLERQLLDTTQRNLSADTEQAVVPDWEPVAEIEIEDLFSEESEEIDLVEQAIDEDEFLHSMNEVLTESVSLINNSTVSEVGTVSPQGEKLTKFKPRTDQWEYEYLEKVISVIEKMYVEVKPINFRDNYEIDYATAYAESIIRRGQMNQNRTVEKMLDEPYFGRVDIESDTYGQETLYIGTYGVDGYIINWQADAAKAYYYKTVGTPVHLDKMGVITVDYIRQIEIRKGQIVNLHSPITADNGFVKDEALIHALSQKRGLEMKEIVATLQKEQYDAVTLPIVQPIIIQGSAGSGKSAIALHRLSYLLYKYQNLKEDSVAYLGPNEAFLSHIKNVLPTLGNYKVKQLTFMNWACDILGISPANITRHHVSDIAIAKGKGSLAFRNYVEKKVYELINDLRNWSIPFEIDGVTISVLTVLSEMQNKKQLKVKARENEYYNYFFRQWKKEFEKEAAYYKQIEQWIHRQSERLVAPILSELKLSDSHLFSDKIPNLAREYHALEDNLKKDEKLNESKLLIERYLDTAVSRITSIIAAALHKLETEEMVNMIWERMVELELNKEQESFMLQVIHTSLEPVTNIDHLMSSSTYLSRLQILKANKVKELEQNKNEVFSLEHKIKCEEILKHCLYLYERELLKRINNEMRRLFKNEFVQLSAKQEPYRTEQKLELTVKVMEKAEKVIKQHVSGVLQHFRYDKLFQQVMELAEKEAILEKPTSASNKAKYYVEDLAALLHIESIINGIPKEQKLSYLIVDEAQDYMPYEIAQMHDLTASKGIMLIGDLGQNINPASSLRSWNELYDIIGEPQIYELKATFRSTAEIVEVSNKIIEPFARGKYQLSTQTMIDGEPVNWIPVNKAAEEKELLALLEELVYEQDMESIAVIVKDESLLMQYFKWIAPYFSTEIQTINNLPKNAKVIITTPTLAKGLEFNTVIMVRFENYEPTDFDRKLAYVAASRAIKQLYILYNENRPLLVSPY